MIDGSTPLEERMRFAASEDADAVMDAFESRPEGHFNEEVTTCRLKFGDNEVTNHNKHAIPTDSTMRTSTCSSSRFWR